MCRVSILKFSPFCCRENPCANETGVMCGMRSHIRFSDYGACVSPLGLAGQADSRDPDDPDKISTPGAVAITGLNWNDIVGPLQC
jgi:hypothetical protein